MLDSRQIRAEQGAVTDAEIFEAHLGGKLSVGPTAPLDTQRALSIAYTPGVAQVSRAIAGDHTLASRYTWSGRLVAVVSDGSAVLGLGDIGPAASLPVMEGKCGLFKEFAGLDAIPIVLDTKDPDAIVETLVRLRPTFGAVNLEDISAPRCFEIERRLVEALDCPVMHDDQHGTAIVVLAALMGATKLLKRDMTTLRIVISGAGAAGVACANLLHATGCADITVLDSRGILHTGRDDLNSVKAELTQRTNPRGLSGGIVEALQGADVFLGLSGGVVPEELIATMASEGIVFALSNPDPEIHPDAAARHAAVVATGRSDFPNQINNVLAFPGVFRGALDAGAHRITQPMLLAAAEAIFSVVRDDLTPGPRRAQPAGPAGRKSGRRRGRGGLRYCRVTAGRLTALVLVAALGLAGCGPSRRDVQELVVGSRPDAEFVLLANIYAGALRSYGFAARVEAVSDPLTDLDVGAVNVIPALTGTVLQSFEPGATVRSDQQVYRAMVGALPEGLAAGDYATAAEDKPALAVTQSTADAWGGTDLSVLPRHCDGLVLGKRGGASEPQDQPVAVSDCRLPDARQFGGEGALFGALQDGHVTVAWTSTADPGVPAGVVLLADGKPALVQAQNVVPLYRRNELSTRALLAINEVAGVLDTAALVDMRREVSSGADVPTVTEAWLTEHPLGR